MLDTRATFSTILNDPALDALLNDAQSKIAEYAPEPQSIDSLIEESNQVQIKAAEVRSNLLSQINDAIALRKEKVAIAVHMFKVASRLVA